MSHHFVDGAMKQSTRQFHKIFVNISKLSSMQCRKKLQSKTTKKRMNIANFMNIYTNIFTYIICDEITQNNNDSKNSILQHGRVVGKIFFVVFPTSGFPYLTLCPRQ